jgi:hypothetical protein
MRISEAARRLGTSARMLRYREDLGLLPQVRDPLPWPSGPVASAEGRRTAAGGLVVAPGAVARTVPARTVPARTVPGAVPGAVPGMVPGAASRPHGPSHRQFSEADLEAVAAALELERRYDISPASLAFGLRVLAEPPVRAAVADLGRRLGRIPATPGRALDFEKERALRLLSRS